MSRLRALGPVLRLIPGARPGAWAGGALLSLAATLSALALLGLAGWFITAMALAGASVATALAFNFVIPSVLIRVLAFLRTGARYGERLLTHDAALAMLARLQVRLFRGWAAAGAAERLARFPARLLFRLTLDIDALQSLYLRLLVPALVAGGVLLLLAGVALVTLPLLWAAVLLLPGLAGLALPLLTWRAAERPARRHQHGVEVLRGRVIQLVSGKVDLVMAGRLPRAEEEIAAADRYVAAQDDALNRADVRAGGGFSLLRSLLFVVVLGVFGWLAPRDAALAPILAACLLIAIAALEPFAALRRGAIEFGRTLMAARRIAPRLGPVPVAPRPARPDESSGLAVELRRAIPPHGGPITLRVAKGEHVALIGPSGAGKSTLLSLIAGAASAPPGRVTAARATLITQRTDLFHDTLRGNLLLAAPGATDADLLTALTAAGLAQVVAGLPQGLDTMLGEQGLGLSRGQGRRLALARLFLRDAPLWLLDEPTDGLDGATARDVMARLRVQGAGRTLIIATHMRREADGATRLIGMARGRIIADALAESADGRRMSTALRPD